MRQGYSVNLRVLRVSVVCSFEHVQADGLTKEILLKLLVHPTFSLTV
jgi:hypothetical protein